MTCSYRRKRITGVPPVATRELDDELAGVERALDCLRRESLTGATNLGIGAVTATAVTVTSDTGADATLPAATAALAGVATAAQVSKLDGIQAGAVAAGAAGDAFSTSHLTAYSHGLIATAVQPARSIATSNGLQGGGDLSANRTLSPVYGTTAGTVCQGNDARIGATVTHASTTLRDASGSHPIGAITSLQTTLDGKLPLTGGALSGALTVGGPLTLANSNSDYTNTISVHATPGEVFNLQGYSLGAASRAILYVKDTAGSYNFHNTGIADAPVSWNDLSDARLKESIFPIVNALDKLLQIQPCTYQFIGSHSTHAGFLAQEVQAVLPEAVSTKEDGYLSVSPMALAALVAQAVKELAAEVSRLQARIAAIESL